MNKKLHIINGDNFERVFKTMTMVEQKYIEEENNKNNTTEKNDSFLTFYTVFAVIKTSLFGGFLIIAGYFLDKHQKGFDTNASYFFLRIIDKSQKLSILYKSMWNYWGSFLMLIGFIILFLEIRNIILLVLSIWNKKWKRVILSIIKSIIFNIFYITFFGILIYNKTALDTNQLTLNCISLIIVCVAHVLSNIFLFKEIELRRNRTKKYYSS